MYLSISHIIDLNLPYLPTLHMGWRLAFFAAALLIVTIMAGAAEGDNVVPSDEDAASDVHGSCFFLGFEQVLSLTFTFLLDERSYMYECMRGDV